MTDFTLHSVLSTLPKGRLVELARQFNVGLNEANTKEAHAKRLEGSRQVRVDQLVSWMGRDELRRACDKHGLASSDRARPLLARRILEAYGAHDSVPPLASSADATSNDTLPSRATSSKCDNDSI